MKLIKGAVGSPSPLTPTPCTPRPQPAPYVSPRLERAIAARWKVWVPWVRMLLLRTRQSDPSVDAREDGAESRRLRLRHSEHILDLLRTGISMRTIRRHRLDDPRLTDAVRAVLVEAARERQSKARFRRSEEQRKEDQLRTLITLCPAVSSTRTDGPKNDVPQARSPAENVVTEPLALPAAIQLIRHQVCEHFYLREMRDPELTVRTKRRAYVLPRQIAVYIARQLTVASLQEIGQAFGGRHHTTVLHAINKIDEMRRSDKASDRVIMRLMDAVARHSAGC